MAEAFQLAGILDPDSSKVLDNLAPGTETLCVPVDDEDRIRIGAIISAIQPNTFAEIKVTIEPNEITLMRTGEEPEPFNIIYETPLWPVRVLGRMVTILTMERHDDNWRLRQIPDSLEVNHSESFAFCLRFIAHKIQKIRHERSVIQAEDSV